MSTETTPPTPTKPTVITNLLQLAQQAPVRFKVSFVFPPGPEGKPTEVQLRALTGAERVEIQQYDVNNVVPPKWGACPPDVAPEERPGEYDLKNPDYLEKRRKMADLFNAFLVDKCLGLGLPETREIGRSVSVVNGTQTSDGGVVEVGLSAGRQVAVTLEDKARWLDQQPVEGLPDNPLPRPYIELLILSCWRLNYGNVAADADF